MHARGADPLDDPEKLAAIMDLWSRLKPLGRMSVNAMMHRRSTIAWKPSPVGHFQPSAK